MTDKTVIEKAKEDYKALVDYIENGMPLPPEDDPYWKASSALDSLGGFIAALEAEKPAETDNHATKEAWWVARKVYDGIKADLSRYPDTYVFNPFASACLIQQFAESYHAARCKEESAAILAASDRLGAALDECESAKYK